VAPLLDGDRLAGAEPAELQIDITRNKPIDDNQFEAELSTIVDNSFNIHPVSGCLVFKHEENARSKLLAHAKNDKLFQHGEDIDHLAKGNPRGHWWPGGGVPEVPALLSSSANGSLIPGPSLTRRSTRSRGTVVCLSLSCRRIPTRSQLPLYLAQASSPGGPQHHPVPVATEGNRDIYYERELLVLARAVYLALQWQQTEKVYADMAKRSKRP